MTKSESRAASILGRKGGSSKSEAKAAAARENGKKGGYPTHKRSSDLDEDTKEASSQARAED